MSLPLSLRLRRAGVRLGRSLRRRVVGVGTTYVGERVGQYREYWRAAATALDAEFVELTETVWEVRRAGRSARLYHYIAPYDDTATTMLAGDKPYGYRVAREAGLPTPEYEVFDLTRLDDAQRFAADHEGPLVVKPARDSASAIGISTHVTAGSSLVRAACLASFFCDEWIVETMHFGESCRLLLLDGELLHAVRRRGVRVRGDGRRPIRDLLPAGCPVDATLERTLAHQALNLDDVPEAGGVVLARSLPAALNDPREPRAEYDESITDVVHPELVRAAATIAEAFGARFAGVDFVVRDPAAPLAGNGVFLELNATPGIHHHDTDGLSPLPVAVRVLSNLLFVSEEP